ncbi:MAG: hypothetical protein GY856_13260 [bacterium]|nr:hypothetical protein [bacterium]
MSQPNTQRARRPIVIVGAGNLETAKLIRAINRVEERWDLVGYVDDDPVTWGRELADRRVVGGVEELLAGELADAAITVSVGATGARREIFERLGGAAERFATLVHPGVDLWGVTVEPGALVFDGVILSPGVRVGPHALVSFRAVVAHDSHVGAFCNLTPGVIVNGRCRLEDGVHVGTGAVILPGVKVGAWATVGAGSVVTRKVASGATVFGVPARSLA